MRVADFNLRTFLPLVHSLFRVRAGAGRVVELELGAARAEGPDDNPFVLAFRGRADEFLPQGTYVFQHETLGEFELFVSPVARTVEHFTTEAVFNRWPAGQR